MKAVTSKNVVSEVEKYVKQKNEKKGHIGAAVSCDDGEQRCGGDGRCNGADRAYNSCLCGGVAVQ